MDGRIRLRSLALYVCTCVCTWPKSGARESGVIRLETYVIIGEYRPRRPVPLEGFEPPTVSLGRKRLRFS